MSKFPGKCKIALYKIGSKLDAKTYRAISLLPLFSKISEKVVHLQTQIYLDENNILYNFQSGFRQNYSTDTALSYRTGKILSGFDEGLYNDMILTGHNIFLEKLICIGLVKKTIAWYRPYLDDRYFKVMLKLVCSVRQGSILGTLHTGHIVV